MNKFLWKTEIAVSFCILYWSLQIRFYGSPSEFKIMLKTKKKPRRSHNRVYHRFGEILCNFFAFTSIHGANHIADDFQRFNKPSTRAKFSKRYSNWIFFFNDLLRPKFYESFVKISLQKMTAQFVWPNVRVWSFGVVQYWVAFSWQFLWSHWFGSVCKINQF